MLFLDPFSLLLGELRVLIFKVIFEKCVLNMVIVLVIFGVIVWVLSGILCFNNYGFIFLFTILFLSSVQNIDLIFSLGLVYWTLFYTVRSFPFFHMTDNFARYINHAGHHSPLEIEMY